MQIANVGTKIKTLDWFLSVNIIRFLIRNVVELLEIWLKINIKIAFLILDFLV